MAALAKFLGKEVPTRAGVGGEIEFPHVKTPSAHWEKTDVPPPADELDPNEDLWGKWSRGVPAGKLKWAPPPDHLRDGPGGHGHRAPLSPPSN